MALGGPAHGVQLVRVQMGFEDAGAAAFGHAVELGQAAGPARHHVGLELGPERRAGAELGAEAGQVMLAELRQRHDALVLHGHQHGVGDAVLLGQLQVAGRVEFGHQYHAAAAAQRGEEHHQRGVGVQRRGQQRRAIGAIAVDAAPVDVGPAHAVRLHDALGGARGARGIDDVERRGRLHAHGRGLRAFGRQPVVKGPAGRGAVQRDALQGAVGRHQVLGRLVEEQVARLGIAQHGGQAVGRGGRRQRRNHHARAQGAQEQRGIAHRVQRADGNRLARLHAVALQRGSHAVHEGVKLRVAQRLLVVAQRGMGRLLARVAADQLGQRGEGRIGRRQGDSHEGLRFTNSRISSGLRPPASWPCGRIGGQAYLAARPRRSIRTLSLA